MAAGDPNNPTPSLQDIINLSNVSPAPAQSANVPPIPMANPEVPQPPTLTNTPLAPALAGPSSPQSLAGPQALAPSAPSESQAQSNAAATPSNNLKAPALPPTAPGSATGLAAPPPPPPSFMDKLKGAAKGVGEGVLGATGLGAFAPGANATPMQKGQAIMGLLGKIGNAGVMATGSPQQKEQAIQQQGQQNQLLQMQNEAAYRRGMLGNTAERNSTYAEKVASDAARKEQQSDLDHLKMNMVKDPVTGTYRTANPDETLNNQFMDHNQQAWHDANTLKQAQTSLDQAKRDAIMNPENPQNKMRQEHYEAQIKMAQQRFDLSNAQFQRGTQQFAKEDEERNAKMVEESYGRNTSLIEKQRQPIDAQVQRLGRLNDTINAGNPQADALIAPELLSVMAGGAGSGLRMNEAEISRIVGGRNVWNDLKAKVMSFNPNSSTPFSFTTTQREQARKLLGEVTSRLNEKEDLLNTAQEAVAVSQNPLEHRQTVANLQKNLTDIDQRSTADVDKQIAQPAAPAKAAAQKPQTPVIPGSAEHQKILSSITLPGGGHPADYANGPSGTIVKVKPGDPWTNLATGQVVK
jgi:hypothetical protein